jgi:hypothetical protein
MSDATAETISNIVLSIGDKLHEKQKLIHASRYITQDDKLTSVVGMPSLALSDVLPFHPLFVSSVKIEYTIMDAISMDINPTSDIKVSVEFQSEKPRVL